MLKDGRKEGLDGPVDWRVPCPSQLPEPCVTDAWPGVQALAGGGGGEEKAKASSLAWRPEKIPRFRTRSVHSPHHVNKVLYSVGSSKDLNAVPRPRIKQLTWNARGLQIKWCLRGARRRHEAQLALYERPSCPQCSINTLARRGYRSLHQRSGLGVM